MIQAIFIPPEKSARNMISSSIQITRRRARGREPRSAMSRRHTQARPFLLRPFLVETVAGILSAASPLPLADQSSCSRSVSPIHQPEGGVMEEFTDPGLLSDDELLSSGRSSRTSCTGSVSVVGCCSTGSISCVRRRCDACGRVSPPAWMWWSLSRTPFDLETVGRLLGLRGSGRLALGARAVGRATPCPVARDRRDPGTTRRDEGCRE